MCREKCANLTALTKVYFSILEKRLNEYFLNGLAAINIKMENLPMCGQDFGLFFIRKSKIFHFVHSYLFARLVQKECVAFPRLDVTWINESPIHKTSGSPSLASFTKRWCYNEKCDILVKWKLIDHGVRTVFLLYSTDILIS